MMLINMAETPELKSATVCDSADISEGRAGIKFDIQGKGKYKTIHGFPCHGYDIAMEDKETGEKYIEEIWATDYIGGADVNFYLYPDVKGVILYSEKTNGKEITIAEAKKIQKNNHGDNSTQYKRTKWNFFSEYCPRINNRRF